MVSDVPTNAEVLIKAFASDWGKGKPPTLEGAFHPDAELIVPESMPHAGGVYRGPGTNRAMVCGGSLGTLGRVLVHPVDLIDAGDKIVVPVRVRGKTHNGSEANSTTSGSTSLKMGRCDEPKCM
jgi:hypothetical protein